ncbi:SPRY domain-containing SOCS box protein 4-like [Stylophora pistillata]|uniref:SPRY domain-containing SOCS box protein 4-like n=1 Tax=Stylophora pistillata TaxID=50429 RepID=UPI000C0458C7|nr:SPRY domain-containing SOCS box protein 4-like [Stylophora pistillata]
MGAEHSIALNQRRTQGSPIDSLFERAVLDALREIAEESSVPSEQIEHAWDPEDCSPRFRVLSDRLTARRLPSPLTTDGIRGKKGYIGGRHVWEITWERDERGSYAVIGIAHPKAPLQCLGYLPLIGSNSESWGWNLSKNVTFHDGNASPYPVNNPGFFVPDTVYCILDMDNLTLRRVASLGLQPLLRNPPVPFSF